MIELYKMVHGIYDVHSCPTLTFNNTGGTRGHKYKLYKRPCKTNVRHNYFTYRVVDMWNSLPSEVVEAPSVNAFKNRLDKFWSNQSFVFNYRADFNYGGRSRDSLT